jgi:hypothetical protein
MIETSAVTESKEVSNTRTRSSIFKIGFWAALIAFVAYAVYDSSFLLSASNFINPLQNSILGYGSSLIIAMPFLIAMLVLHYTVPEEKKFWTNAGLLLATIYTTLCSLNYVVQLTTVIPAGYSWTLADQQGTQGPLSLLNQTPHSLFWDMDALGYIFMSLAFAFAFPVFGKQGLQKWVRLFFLANVLDVPLFAITYFYPTFSTRTMLFALPGGILAPGAILLLALFLRRSIGFNALAHESISAFP